MQTKDDDRLRAGSGWWSLPNWFVERWQMRALIVDDDTIGSRVLAKFLSPYGQCDLVTDGLEAINAFVLASTEKRPYDVVFLDIMMPVMDGHETLRMIRQLEDKYCIAKRNRVKVIMITGSSERDHIIRAAVDKCSAYLVKPVQKGKVLEKLKTLGLVPDDSENGWFD